MQTRVMVILAILAGLVSSAFLGCGPGQASGKLQVMYSGNIRGNVAPCG